jgi:hypothetical protein
MRMHRFVWVLSALGVLGVTYVVYRSLGSDNVTRQARMPLRDQSATVSAPGVSKSNQTQDATGAALPPSQSSQKGGRIFSAATLPTKQLPLAKSYEELKRSADEGNPFAACRLADAVYKCELYPMMKNELNDSKQLLKQIDPASTEGITQLSQVTEFEKEVTRYAQVCEGFSNKDKIESWKYLLQAALAGNVAAKAGFVLSPPVNTNGPFANIEFAEAYRANAPSLLIEAATAGSRTAAEGAAWSYLGKDGSSVFNPGSGLQLLPRDPVKAAYYFYASEAFPVREQSHINRRERLKQRVEAVTTLDQREKAKTEANALVASWELGGTDWLTRADEREKRGESFYGYPCED